MDAVVFLATRAKTKIRDRLSSHLITSPTPWKWGLWGPNGWNWRETVFHGIENARYAHNVTIPHLPWRVFGAYGLHVILSKDNKEAPCPTIPIHCYEQGKALSCFAPESIQGTCTSVNEQFWNEKQANCFSRYVHVYESSSQSS